MQNLAKVKEHENLMKDMDSGAVLLSDKTAMNEYKSKKNMLQNMRDVSSEINTIKQKLSELDSVKTDMQEIKELLRGLAR